MSPPPPRRRSAKLAVWLTLALPAGAAGQAISPGFELERSGRYAEAAAIYTTTVRSDPMNVPALLGLERTLFVLNRMPELVPLVQRARARAPENPALRSLEVRVYAAINQPDSLEAVVRRWAAAAPQSEVPYREWGLALADRRATLALFLLIGLLAGQAATGIEQLAIEAFLAFDGAAIEPSRLERARQLARFLGERARGAGIAAGLQPLELLGQRALLGGELPQPLHHRIAAHAHHRHQALRLAVHPLLLLRHAGELFQRFLKSRP